MALHPFAFDAHSDLMTDVAYRRSQGERQVILRRHLPRMRAGGVAVAIAVIWVRPFEEASPWQQVREALAALAAELRESPQLHLIRSRQDLAEATAPQPDHLYLLLGFEGLHFLGREIDFLPLLALAGAHHASLTWTERNDLAAGNSRADLPEGLTTLGRAAVALLERERMVVDVSHLNVQSFWDVLGGLTASPLASHSNARALCDHPRNLSDKQLRAMAQRGGVVGLNAWPTFVDKDAPTLSRLLDHAVHMAEVMGPEHLALGLDFADYLPPPVMGGLGHLQTTAGIEDTTCVPALLEGLETRGFSPAEITAIAHGNLLRLLGQVLVP